MNIERLQYQKDKIERDEKIARINFLKRLKDEYALKNVFKAENNDDLLENVFEDWEIYYSSSDNSDLEVDEEFDSAYVKNLYTGKEKNGQTTTNKDLEMVTSMIKDQGLLIYNITPEINRTWKEDLTILNSSEFLYEIDELRVNPYFAVFQIQRENE